MLAFGRGIKTFALSHVIKINRKHTLSKHTVAPPDASTVLAAAHQLSAEMMS